MNEQEKLGKAARSIARAYIFLHLNIFLGTLNLLPNWVGYILIFDALLTLSTESESAKKLQPLAILIGIWEGILWFITLLGGELNIYILTIIATLIDAYFHFQLLTNLANIAEKYECPERSKILNLRTVRTVLITLLSLPFAWNDYTGLSIVILLANAIVAVWITVTLYSLRRSLLEDRPNNIIYCDDEEE